MLASRTSLLSLEPLIAPLTAEQFLADYWRRKLLHHRGGGALVDELKAILGGFEPRHLVSRGASISAMSYAGARTERHDHVSPQQALDFYERGYTLYFNLHNTVREAHELLNTVIRDIGVTPVNAFCSIFISKTSGGLRPHYDQNENFTIQLAGQKTWTFWPNTQVDNPIHAYRHGEALGNSESAMYLDPSLQRADLGAGVDVDMSAGAVLYHPPGSWHATKAGAESISLNVCIQPASYYDLLIGAAAARLAASTPVRLHLPPARADQDGARFRDGLEHAIAGAQASFAEIDPADAAALASVPRGLASDIATAAAKSSISADTQLRRNALAAFDIDYQPSGAVLIVHLFLGRLTNRVTLKIPAGLEAACVKAASQRAPFTPASLADADISADAALNVCRALEAVAALRSV